MANQINHKMCDARQLHFKKIFFIIFSTDCFMFSFTIHTLQCFSISTATWERKVKWDIHLEKLYYKKLYGPYMLL